MHTIENRSHQILLMENMHTVCSKPLCGAVLSASSHSCSFLFHSDLLFPASADGFQTAEHLS